MLLPHKYYLSRKAVIRPRTEKIEIASKISGKILTSNVVDNRMIEKDEGLLFIESPELDENLKFIKEQIEYNKKQVADLNELLKNKFSGAKPKLAVYKQELSEIKNQLWKLKVNYNKNSLEYEQAEKAFKKEIISKNELRNKKFSLKQSTAEIQNFIEQKRFSWEQQKESRKKDLEDFSARLKKLEIEKEFYKIKSPISGTIEKTNQLAVGSFISSGQKVCTISPNDSLIVESLVSPKDIGLLKKGMNANYRIDAFNYNNWGILTGKIESISSDYILFDNRPMFRVKSSLSSKFLSLKNGFQGKIKKGMTLSSSFQISEQSLWSILFNDMNNWLNPKM